MPASIILKDLSWSTPDGIVLFDGLDLAFGPARTGLVGRNGVGKSTLLKIVAGEIAPAKGIVSSEGRIATLRQQVQDGPREAVADAFGLGRALALIERIEKGLAALDEIAEADCTLQPRMQDCLAQLGLPALDAGCPMARLSGGQATRVRLASILFQDPDMILLDEPTNNLDAEGRVAVTELLARWSRGAVVVSHDRTLLEQMDAIVELTTIGARTYGGNWSHYRACKARELDALRHRLDTAERKVADVDRRLQAAAERKARKDAAGRRKRAKGDTPKIMLDAMKERAEGTGGAQAKLAARMRQAAAAEAEEARTGIEKLKELSVGIRPTGLPKGRLVAEARCLSGGYGMGQKPVVRNLSFSIAGPERVAIVGPNGSGKTTLLRLLTGSLKPSAGDAKIHVRHAVLDQTMSLLDPRLTVRDNFMRLNPEATENVCRAALARFLFRNDAALKPVRALSGGQILRAGLAAVLGGEHPPELLLLDEPTNHLDLESIQALEAGLSVYDGALIVVSHDRAFLDAVGIEREIELKTMPAP